MSINIPAFFAQQYATNIELLLQQKGSRLRPAVSTKSYVGKAAQVVDQVGALVAQKVTSRFAPMGRQDAVLDSRWVYPVDYDLPQMIDSFDKLRLITDPQSAYVENAVAALGRAQDVEILAGMFGTNKTGIEGATSTVFLPANVISVSQGASAATGLTVAKLRAAKKLLMAAEVDLDSDPLYCAITAAQHDNLLAEAQVISTDFNDKPVLVDGKVMRFLGINFIHTELLTTGTDDAAGTSTAVPLWAKSGVHMGIWNDIMTSTSIRHDIQSEPFQAYVMGTFGATRTQEKKVTKIWCR